MGWTEPPLLGHRENSQGCISHWGLGQRCVSPLHQKMNPWFQPWVGVLNKGGCYCQHAKTRLWPTKTDFTKCSIDPTQFCWGWWLCRPTRWPSRWGPQAHRWPPCCKDPNMKTPFTQVGWTQQNQLNQQSSTVYGLLHPPLLNVCICMCSARLVVTCSCCSCWQKVSIMLEFF